MDPYTATMLAAARFCELSLFILQNTPKEVLEARANRAYEIEEWWYERVKRMSALFDNPIRSMPLGRLEGGENK